MSPDQSADARIVARVRGGETDAYAELVRRHAAVARRTAVLLGAGSGAGFDADDVVQEAFVKAYRSLGSFRPGSPFRPWLLRIVANETRNAHRSSVRRDSREETATLRSPELLVAPDPAVAVLGADRRSALLDAIRELPERQRLAVVCRYLLELDEAETATVLGWPRGSVKSALHRALGRLRVLLPEEVTDDA